MKIDNDNGVDVIGCGTLPIEHLNRSLALSDSLCVPSISNAIISVAAATFNNLRVYFDEHGKVQFLEPDGTPPTGTIVACGHRQNRAFWLESNAQNGPSRSPSVITDSDDPHAFVTQSADSDVWHHRLSPLGFRTLKQILDSISMAMRMIIVSVHHVRSEARVANLVPQFVIRHDIHRSLAFPRIFVVHLFSPSIRTSTR